MDRALHTITESLEKGRGNCIVLSPDKDCEMSTFRCLTGKLDLFNCYHQKGDNSSLVVPLRIKDADFEWGFQYDSSKDYLLTWDHLVLKHHMEFNLVKTNNWKMNVLHEKVRIPIDKIPGIKKFDIYKRPAETTI